ncbi:hypothetical protein POTOM_037037 [Populus tomentosa]|uniref:Uncharacterized protein n=1 Tax=Populus tomentosa TaxID=118781 RepID=A0A8X7YZY4_POPTO|nr:hypothetical protein POTOM_037037 [Populus tomentosa]
MVDFPPNLEDGESWLPSDVFLEIISTTNASKVKNNDNNLLVRDHPTLKSSVNVAGPAIQIHFHMNCHYDHSLNQQIFLFDYGFKLFSFVFLIPKLCDALGGSKQNVESPTGTRVPSVNHGYHPCCWNHGFEVVSGPFNTHSSKIMTPTHKYQTEGFKSRNDMFVYRKSEGTGVFLPRFNKPFSKGSGVLPRGTGVFLNHQVMDNYTYERIWEGGIRGK